MKFAAIILAYKEPEQVNILIKQLIKEFSDDIDVFVHVSAGSEWMIDGLLKSEQVFIFPEHIGYRNVDGKNRKGQWAEDILLKKILYCLSYTRKQSESSYILVLSGEDLIVKNGLKKYLEDNSKTIFMDGMVSDKKQRARLLYKWGPSFKTQYKCKLHPLRILRRFLLMLYSTGININKQKNSKLFDGYTICKNLYWMCLPSDCVDYLLSFVANNIDIMDIFYKSMCPEESFFSTVLYNCPHFKERFNWVDDCRYKSLTYFGKFTTSFPLITEDDVEAIHNSNCYFAKKFSYSANRKLVDYFLSFLEEQGK